VSTFPDHAERRQGARVDLLGQFQGHLVALDEEVRVLQLGPGGMTIATAVPLAQGQQHDLQLTLGEERLTLKARIVHTRTTIDRDEFTYVAGVAFVDLPAESARTIDAFIAHSDA
jgi:hypothetical protein